MTMHRLTPFILLALLGVGCGVSDDDLAATYEADMEATLRAAGFALSDDPPTGWTSSERNLIGRGFLRRSLRLETWLGQNFDPMLTFDVRLTLKPDRTFRVAWSKDPKTEPATAVTGIWRPAGETVVLSRAAGQETLTARASERSLLWDFCGAGLLLRKQ